MHKWFLWGDTTETRTDKEPVQAVPWELIPSYTEMKEGCFRVTMERNWKLVGLLAMRWAHSAWAPSRLCQESLCLSAQQSQVGNGSCTEFNYKLQVTNAVKQIVPLRILVNTKYLDKSTEHNLLLEIGVFGIIVLEPSQWQKEIRNRKIVLGGELTSELFYYLRIFFSWCHFAGVCLVFSLCSSKLLIFSKPQPFLIFLQWARQCNAKGERLFALFQVQLGARQKSYTFFSVCLAAVWRRSLWCLHVQ